MPRAAIRMAVNRAIFAAFPDLVPLHGLWHNSAYRMPNFRRRATPDHRFPCGPGRGKWGRRGSAKAGLVAGDRAAIRGPIPSKAQWLAEQNGQSAASLARSQDQLWISGIGLWHLERHEITE